MLIAPNLRFVVKDRIVVGDVASERNIAHCQDGGGPFARHLLHQPLPDSGIRQTLVRGIGKPLVAVHDQRQGLPKLRFIDAERRPRLTQQTIGGHGRRRGKLRLQGEREHMQEKGW